MDFLELVESILPFGAGVILAGGILFGELVFGLDPLVSMPMVSLVVDWK